MSVAAIITFVLGIAIFGLGMLIWGEGYANPRRTGIGAGLAVFGMGLLVVAIILASG